jgi:hypothetical protein
VAYPDGRFERGYFGVSISGEGAMVSTVEDMLIWLRHMHRPVVGSAESWREMKTPMRLNNGGTAGYGLGLMESDHRGVKVLHHSGGVVGGVCMCLTVEALELDVIIIANRSDAPVQPLGFTVVDACVEGLAEATAAGGGRAPVGAYYCRETASPLNVTQEGDAVTLKLHDAQAPMRADGDGRLTSAIPVIDVTVTAIEGDPDALRVDLRGSTDVFRRIAVGEDDPLAEAARLAGAYRCDEAEAKATVKVEDNRVSVVMDGPYGRDLFVMQRLTPMIWTSKLGESNFGGVLEFEADGEAVTGFNLSTARTTRLPFERVG